MSSLYNMKFVAPRCKSSHQPHLMLRPRVHCRAIATQRRVSTQSAQPDQLTARDLRLDSESNPYGRAAAPSRPLSGLPTANLMRSLLFNAVSSSPILLGASIRLLSYISRPDAIMLLSLQKNKPLAWLLKQLVYKQFCAGESTPEVHSTLKSMKQLGFRGTILTYGKEMVFDQKKNAELGIGVGDDSAAAESSGHIPSVQIWRDGTMATVNMLSEGDQLAIKMTGAGPRVTDCFAAGKLPPKQMLEALYEVSDACKAKGVSILVDAESQQYQSGIFITGLELMRRCNTDGYAVIYNTFQAYLKSTPATLEKHLGLANSEGFTIGLKVVRGAYMDTDRRDLIHDTKEETDRAYDGIVQGVLRQQVGSFGEGQANPFPSLNLMLGSHNKKSLLAAYELHQERLRLGLPTVPVGFAQLHGMSDEVSFTLLSMEKGGAKEGSRLPGVYKCSTWGEIGDCMAYLARRACENRDAVSRTRDEYTALKRETWRRMRSVFSAS